MQKEFKALLDNKTWILVILPSDKKIINCKWIFKVKLKSENSLDKYKSRVVSRGIGKCMASTNLRLSHQ